MKMMVVSRSEPKANFEIYLNRIVDYVAFRRVFSFLVTYLSYRLILQKLIRNMLNLIDLQVILLICNI